MRALRLLTPGLCLLATVLGFTGCAGYQLGTGTAPKFTTLFVAPVTSEALVPQARVELTTRLREAFLRDGRVQLAASAESADAVLQVTIARYGRTLAVSQPTDTGLARRFDLNLQARASLLKRGSEEPYFADRVLEATRGVFTDDGLVPAESQIIPVLADSLANEAVHAVLDTW
ncbi:hypothetical protein Verru16b_02488 [Lacunisphaera limnophila]|uniref:Lipopolysaccharide-assembly n=1 Tax=Lacunisphaera limnophila TaxID=1838286 RepID=A0A1D8AX19_9BACT|nr:LPS assembly lipoprotein LptE [Lacunisphaera limnophila]AOS45407.1 hypothetical protein Verru16b_02488 [Lacunisphaera limnophila]